MPDESTIDLIDQIIMVVGIFSALILILNALNSGNYTDLITLLLSHFTLFSFTLQLWFGVSVTVGITAAGGIHFGWRKRRSNE